MFSVTLNKKHSSKQVVPIRKVVFAASEGALSVWAFFAILEVRRLNIDTACERKI